MLRNEGDSVNFSGLGITNTSMVSMLEAEQRSWNPFWIFFGLGNSKPTADHTLYIDGARDSNSFGRSRLIQQFSHSGWKSHLHGTMETIHAIHHSTTIHTTPLYPTTESKANVETIDATFSNHTILFIQEWLILSV